MQDMIESENIPFWRLLAIAAHTMTMLLIAAFNRSIVKSGY